MFVDLASARVHWTVSARQPTFVNTASELDEMPSGRVRVNSTMAPARAFRNPDNSFASVLRFSTNRERLNVQAV